MIDAYPKFGTRLKQRLGLTASQNLFWACRENGNFGDWIGPFLFESLSGETGIYCTVKHRSVRSVYLTAGSVFQHIKVSGTATVWGSGIMKRDAMFRRPKIIHAVRGPQTRKRCLEVGVDCPEVYGDPGILLPYFLPQPNEPAFEVGIVPHFVDYDAAVRLFAFEPNVRIINVLDDLHSVVKNIAQCSTVISSSLHGIIIANAFGRPAMRALFSDRIKGDGIKYADYAESISPDFYLPVTQITDPHEAKMAIRLVQSTERPPDFLSLQKALIAACPFAKTELVPDALRRL